MRPSPLVSVVVPHLNEPENLRKCLRSLDAQRLDGVPFEVIVVDNGSEASPWEICSATRGVRLETERIPGPGPARNRGALTARGTILAFIDADCEAQPGWLRAIANAMEENSHIDIVGGDIEIHPTDPKRPTSIEAYERIFGYRTQFYIERHGYAATGNMAVRATVFDAVGPFGGISTMEDAEWGRRATNAGYRIAFLPGAKVVTPSCKSFRELARRWDRHLAHEFHRVERNPISMLRWFSDSAMVAASPLIEAGRILRSDRISGGRVRWLAFLCLTRIRAYRARRMIGLALQGNAAAIVEGWNRETSIS